MRSFLLFITLLGALTLSSSLTSPVTSAANESKKDQAATKFNEPVTLMGVTLKGEYLFVHDDAAMARGEACTYVYKGLSAVPSKLVVSFHCTPAARNKVAHFTLRSVMILPGEYQLREFQFAGSSEAHIVPSSLHADHESIAD